MLDASLATSADYRDRFDEVIRRVIYDLPSIAKVHSISLFVNRVEHTFAHWLIDETKNSLKGRRQAEVIKFFDRADAAASSIFGILESIREDTLEAAWSQQRAEDLDINILEFHLKVRKLLEQLGAPDVDSLQAIMGAFALVAKRYKQQVIEETGLRLTRRGRRRTWKEFCTLVFRLEYAAQVTGGNFTLDKRLKKGSLLDALDSIKRRLLLEHEWCWICEFMPAPKEHPVANYERALSSARAAAAGLLHLEKLHSVKSVLFAPELLNGPIAKAHAEQDAKIAKSNEERTLIARVRSLQRMQLARLK